MLPHVILHNIVSLDGRMDWFMPDVGLFYEIVSFWKEDASLAGSGTILKALEHESAAEESIKSSGEKSFEADKQKPLLIVPDSKGKITKLHLLKKQPYWRDVIVLGSSLTPRSYLEYLYENQIEYIISGDDHVDFYSAFEILNSQYKVNVIRVDSGGILNGVLLRAGLVDEVSILISPSLVGGFSPNSFYRAPDLKSSEGVISLNLIHFERLREDIIWLRYKVTK
jgi:2,5-diamino-6-(ribosylamino)-4(3H)-pyrimidinone 5'-phosphate reductase